MRGLGARHTPHGSAPPDSLVKKRMVRGPLRAGRHRLWWRRRPWQRTFTAKRLPKQQSRQPERSTSKGRCVGPAHDQHNGGTPPNQRKPVKAAVRGLSEVCVLAVPNKEGVKHSDVVTRAAALSALVFLTVMLCSVNWRLATLSCERRRRIGHLSSLLNLRWSRLKPYFCRFSWGRWPCDRKEAHF